MKDKRTRDDLIRLLDKAMGHEEKLTARLSELETQLLECQKRADDPGHELSDSALHNSKVPFRIDFYRTSDNGPLKGVIEHLPSRKKKSFNGRADQVIADFIERYVPAGPEQSAAPAPPVEPAVSVPAAAVQPDVAAVAEVSPRLRRLAPDLFAPEPASEPNYRLIQRTGRLFEVVTAEQHKHQGSLSQHSAFAVQIPLEGVQTANSTPLLARLQAENLESGHSEWVANATANADSDTAVVPVKAGILPPGAYRFTASLADASGLCYRESRLVVVV